MNEEMIPKMDGIYFFARTAWHQLQPQRCSQFDSEACENILHAAYTMDKLFNNLNRSYAAETALEEFKEQVSKPNSENPFERVEVDRKFRAFIFEWKMFAEHWKNYIYGLNTSKCGDQYVDGYKRLYRQITDNAFQSQEFVLAHVIRNYVSHANDAIDSCHIGEENTFWIHKVKLQSFLSGNIAKRQNRRTKAQLEKQKSLIDSCDDKIDLMAVADSAMRFLQEMQEQLMNYQLTQEIFDSCVFLLSTKEKIDRESAGVWELWKPVSDPCWNGKICESITLKYEHEGKKMTAQFGRIRLNWDGYWAIASYIVQLVQRNQTLKYDDPQQ